MTALLYRAPSPPTSQNPPTTIELSAAADQLAKSETVSAAARASSASRNMYPDVASSGSRITWAPALTASRICCAIAHALAAKSPSVGVNWQQATRVMLEGYGLR